MIRFPFSSIEPLEARIAPASLSVFHPIPDIIPSQGETGTTIDLANSFDSDSASSYRTHVVFTTNYDTDPLTPGIQAGQIVLELFNDKTPLTVQNFISYVEGAFGHGGYTGTYFSRSVPGFVLQGGGFEDAKPTQHIAVGAPVHTEAHASDPELSNAVGTVAMALSNGPSSGTSEFFFNLANNNNPNGNDLDTQNGGFTVFAKVVSGMNVVNAIAHLPTANIGVTSGSGGTPYQNGYQPDPDGNSNTAPPTPKPNQLVDIVSAKVIPPTIESLPGVTYSVSSITDDSTGLPTKMVTAKLNGHQLSLHYTAGASGVADVTVEATQAATATTPAQSVEESFQVRLTPNLVGQVTSDSLQGAYLQVGDTGTEKVKITNTGGGASTGHLTVNYYLSANDGSDPLDSNGTHVDANDLLIGSFTSAKSITLAGGQSITLSSGIEIPSNGPVTLADGTYYILAQVGTTNTDPLHGNFYTDDDVSVGSQHTLITGTRAPDIAIQKISDRLPDDVVPGDTAKGFVTLVNDAQPVADGLVHVQFYMVENTHPGEVANSTTMISLGGGDYPVHLGPTQTTQIAVPLSIPSSLTLDPLYYQVMAVVSSGATNPVADSVSTDNSLSETGFHALVDRFGTFVDQDPIFGKLPVRRNVALTYTDSNNDLVTLALHGPGSGSVRADTDGGIVWQLEDTTAASSLHPILSAAAGNTLAAGAHTVVKDIFAGVSGEAVGTLALGLVDWTDAVSLGGSVHRLTLGNTSGSGDHSIVIGGTAGGAAIALGDVQDTSLISSAPLATLAAGTWTSVNGDTQTVQAPGIGTFDVPGDFTANLTVTPAHASAAQVVKNFIVGGSLLDTTVSLGGNVGSVRIGAIQGSDFLVGAAGVPQSAQDLDSTFTLASLRIGNISGSDVAAAKIGTVVVSTVNPDNDLSTFGIEAEKIASYTRQAVHATNLAYHAASPTPGEFDVDGDYRVALFETGV